MSHLRPMAVILALGALFAAPAAAADVNYQAITHLPNTKPHVVYDVTVTHES